MKKRKVNSICVVLFVFSALAVLKTIWISMDIDESYALAVGYRLATGEKLFSDLWEAHQLGGIVLAPILWPYLKLAGTTTYLVLYARVAGTLIHILIGIFLYRTAVRSGKMGASFSAVLFFLHLNFLPKWVQCPEFELQQYWFVLLTFLCFYRYYAGGSQKKGYLAVSGIMLAGQMFSYPTLILLYPLYLVGIIRCGKECGKKKKTAVDVGWFTAGAAAAGILFLGYLRSYMTPGKFLEYMGCIFQDESHMLVSAAVKWKIFGAQFLKILLPAGIVLGLSMAAGSVLARKRQKKTGIYFALSIALILLGGLQAAGCLFGNENQFYMLWRFFAVSLLGILVYPAERTEENKRCLWFGILPGFMTLLSVLIMTNMDVNTSMAKMYIGVIAAVWMLGLHYEAEEDVPDMPVSSRGTVKVWNVQEISPWERYLLWAGTLFFLAGLFVCKLVQMRVSGCMEITVLAPMRRIEEGPAKGIYMVEDTALVLEDDYRVLRENLSAKDRLLYVGSENIVYLWTEAQIATPSTQGTNAYNEMFIRYYEEHPEKMPTVIVVDKELGENPVYYNSPQNHILYEWMEKSGYAETLDASYMKIYRR